VEILKDSERTVVRASRSRAFDSRLFRLSSRTENTGDGQITSDLTCFDGMVSGTVTNGLSVTLKDASIFLYGQMLPLGDLKPGETKRLNEEKLLVWPVGMTWVSAGNLAGLGDGTDTEDSEYLRSVELTNMYSFFLEKYYGQYNGEVRLAAFEEDAHAGFLAAKDAVADGLTLHTAVLDVKFEDDGTIYRSACVREPEVTSGSGTYYGSSSVLYGSEPMVLEYFLGDDIDVEKLSFLPVSDEFLSNPRYSYTKRFTGEAYFYRPDTGVYEPVDLSVNDFTGEDLSGYLSQENSLIVQYIGGESDATGGSYALPLLMVTGRER
jgi:hypothetical protein